MKKVLIAYASRTGNTQQIAEQIAEGVRLGGAEAVVKDVKEIKEVEELDGYAAIILGSPTYHGEMLQSVKTFLFLMEEAKLKEKVGGVFGSYGWSGEAQDRIYNTMRNIFDMKVMGGAFRLKSPEAKGAVKASHDYGRTIVKKLRR
ncbi:MAG: FprA family A-type flavoprotein [Deltaproteobacteria bacterium]|uniref:FprA family A-type flavoprotein n=1 Tax=Candidatus Zymogenus saltonus TaxID=2844893 RepID=A0A9D8KE26_9DELT|nr:FprA family A-type flavoprotein [Candidatus Zymogenus saltonus]